MRSRHEGNPVLKPLVAPPVPPPTPIARLTALYQARDDDAVILLGRSLFKEYPHSEVIANALGSSLSRQGQHEDALAVYDEALTHHTPGLCSILNNKGNALRRMERLDEAIASFQLSVAQKPDGANTWNSLGFTFYRANRLGEATHAYEQAVRLSPEHADAHTNLAFALLKQGNYSRGFREYEYRLNLQKGRMPPPPAGISYLRAGECGVDEIIVVGEQGMGDTIQFARYGPLLKPLAKQTTLMAYDNLGGLLSHADLFGKVVKKPYKLGDPRATRRWIPLMSLPLFFGTTPDTIPFADAYLTPPDARMEKWRALLTDGGVKDEFRIAIAWQGKKSTERNLILGRSAALEEFGIFSDNKRVRFVALQKGNGADDLDGCSFRDRFVSAQEKISETWDVEDTAAIIKNCHLVITADVFFGHLAAACGVPTWIFLHTSSDWRWLDGRDDSLWYNSVRLFRQQTYGVWKDVFTQIRVALDEVLKP